MPTIRLLPLTKIPKQTTQNCAKAAKAIVAPKLTLNGMFSVIALCRSTLLTYLCIVLTGRRLYPFDAAYCPSQPYPQGVKEPGRDKRDLPQQQQSQPQKEPQTPSKTPSTPPPPTGPARSPNWLGALSALARRCWSCVPACGVRGRWGLMPSRSRRQRASLSYSMARSIGIAWAKHGRGIEGGGRRRGRDRCQERRRCGREGRMPLLLEWTGI